jgi:hypothetical protein
LAIIELSLAADWKREIVAVSAVGLRLPLFRSTVRFQLFAFFHSEAAMVIVAAYAAATLQHGH